MVSHPLVTGTCPGLDFGYCECAITRTQISDTFWDQLDLKTFLKFDVFPSECFLEIFNIQNPHMMIKVCLLVTFLGLYIYVRCEHNALFFRNVMV